MSRVEQMLYSVCYTSSGGGGLLHPTHASHLPPELISPSGHIPSPNLPGMSPRLSVSFLPKPACPVVSLAQETQ